MILIFRFRTTKLKNTITMIIDVAVSGDSRVGENSTERDQGSTLTFQLTSLKPGFHIIAPVATITPVVEKSVLTQMYFLSDASDRMFPYNRRCRSISRQIVLI